MDIQIKDHQNWYASILLDGKEIGVINYGYIGISNITKNDINKVIEKFHQGYPYPIFYKENNTWYLVKE